LNLLEKRADAVRPYYVTDPFQPVKYTEVTPETPFFAEAPFEFESEVAANLAWEVEPSGAAQFDVATDLTAAMSFERKVIFNKLGIYRIFGRSAYPTPADSNVIAITIRPGS